MKQKKKSVHCSVCAMCAALFVVCSWVNIPTSPPFTLQSFAVFTVVGIFGTRISFNAYLLYFFLGLTGLPVFSGFSGGFAVLTGPTGGFLVGFGVSIIIIGLACRLPLNRRYSLVISFILGTFVIYTTGTLYYALIWLGELSLDSLISAISICVLPFAISDIVKIVLAVFVTERLEGRIKL